MSKALTARIAMSDEAVPAIQDQPREKLKIPEVPGEGDQVEVCINGYWTVIRRGADVEVPQSVAMVLRQAQII